MAKEVKAGMTDYSVFVFIPDPASTDGSGKTGLVAANLTVSAARMETDNDATITDYTSSLNDLAALTTAHTDWGVLEVSSTLAPGLYRLDIADAVFASGAWSAVVYVMITSSAAAASPIEFILVPQAPIDGVLLAPTTHTSAVIPTVTNVTTVNGLAAGVITAASIAADAITDAKVASDVTIASVTGAVGSVTGNVGGNVTGSVGSIATGGIVAASFAAGAIDAAAIATDAIGSSELAASAITEIQAGLSTLDAAGIRTAVGLASANLDTQLSTIDDFLDTEVAAIKAKTDNLPGDPADASDIASSFSTVNSTLATIAAYIDTEISTLLTRLGTPSDLGSGASIAANLVDIEGQTDDIGAAGAGLTAVFAANTVEGTYDAKETLKLLLAYIAGKTTITGVSGDNATVTFRDTGDTVDRIVAAMIGSERDSVTLNVT